MIDEGVSASRVVFHRVCCSAANEHFRSVNFVTHTPPPLPPLHLQRTSVISVISPIGLCSFLTSLSSFRARALEIEGCMFESVYTGLFARYTIFFLFFSTLLLSLSFSHFFFPLCARVYRSPGFVWKKGRDTFLITSREPRLDTSIFGHWHATIFFFYGSFYMLVFLLLLFFFLLIFR